jgi:two-component sensor histidine kinase
MKYSILILISLFCFQNNFGQTPLTHLENCILNQKQDSAIYYLKKVKTSDYKNSLERIVTAKKPSYNDYYVFISKVGNRSDFHDITLSIYINSIVKTPTNRTAINLDFVKIKWLQIKKLRDDASIATANEEQQKLENYIKIFNPNDIDVQKANILKSTHQMVLYSIAKKVEKGKTLCLENLKKAKRLKDPELEAIIYCHLRDFLLFEGKLEEYIKICEKSLAIEKTLPHHTPYYVKTIIHTVDAYIYKGGYSNQVETLLQELVNNKDTKNLSYSLYAKLLGTLEDNDPVALKIYKQFEVKNLLEFGIKTSKLGKETLSLNDFYQLQRELSKTHIKYHFYDEGVRYMQNVINITKELYAEELASSLADFQTQQAINKKNVEIEKIEQKNRLYVIIGMLNFILALIFIYFSWRIKNKNKTLNKKNKIINDSFDKIQELLKEKELLVKEVHHRVKNSFQIVSSLLELQTKGIEDKRALALAKEGQQRIKSMALIHKQLYKKKSGLIDFNEYIKLLIQEFSVLYMSSVDVSIKTDIIDKQLDVDTAIPLGLIINELITNAYKYALQKNKKNTLYISMSDIHENEYKLIIKDNGAGMPETLDLKTPNSLGIRLVNMLTKQLHGTLKQTNDNGCVFEITFKNGQGRQEVL